MKEMQNILNYNFKNPQLLNKALTHKSYTKKHSNERLEFLGDAVLDLIVARFLYDKFIQYNEGELSRLRAEMVSEKSFAKLAKNISLDKFIIMSQSEQKNNGREKPSILSDAFEALMGAIYLDSSLASVEKIFLQLLQNEYKDISIDNLASDYKSKLQEITQAKFGVVPCYKLENQTGPDHNKEFELSIYIDDKFYAKAKAKSKKQAEQKLAKEAIELLQQNNK